MAGNVTETIGKKTLPLINTADEKQTVVEKGKFVSGLNTAVSGETWKFADSS